MSTHDETEYVAIPLDGREAEALLVEALGPARVARMYLEAIRPFVADLPGVDCSAVMASVAARGKVRLRDFFTPADLATLKRALVLISSYLIVSTKQEAADDATLLHTTSLAVGAMALHALLISLGALPADETAGDPLTPVA